MNTTTTLPDKRDFKHRLAKFVIPGDILYLDDTMWRVAFVQATPLIHEMTLRPMAEGIPIIKEFRPADWLTAARGF